MLQAVLFCNLNLCLSFPQISFDLAEYTADVDGIGTLRLLDAIKTCGLINSVKFYQASTSELFGKVQEIPQKETTPFYPRSPYGKCVSRSHTASLFCRYILIWQCIQIFEVPLAYPDTTVMQFESWWSIEELAMLHTMGLRRT